MAPLLIGVMGETASGKTALAEEISSRLEAPLINADAFQAYVGMDVGTAKPQARERYRLLDIKRPDEAYGAGEFCLRAAAELAAIHGEGRSAVVVGGTGQYIRALFEEYRDLMPDPDPAMRDALSLRLAQEGLPKLAEELRRSSPETAARIDLQNPVRVTRALERLADGRLPLNFRVPYVKRLRVSVGVQKTELEARIVRRTSSMMHNGWVEEVRRLFSDGYEIGNPGFRAIGYRTIAKLIDGDLATEKAEQAIVQETMAYAKRQRTWLRSEPGPQIAVHGSPKGLEEAWKWILSAPLEF